MTQSPVSPSIAARRSNRRTADVVATIFALVLLLGATAVLAVFSLMSVMMTDSCGTGVSEPAVCNGNYFAVVFFGYWAGLVGVPLLATIGSVVAMARRRLSWPYAAGGLVGLGVVTVVYVVLMTR